MKKGAMRWVVGLLAGGALAMVGCEGSRGERPGTGAFRTPIQDKYQSPAAEAAEHGDERLRHPTDEGRVADPGKVPGDTAILGGTAGPNSEGMSGAGAASQPVVPGLDLSLADSYRAPAGQDPGGTATGGSGAAGTQGGGTAPGGGTSGSATQGNTPSGGAGTASGGGASGQEGPR